MAKAKSAHAELDRLRQQNIDDRVQARAVETQFAAAEANVEHAVHAITTAHADQDDQAVARARKAGEQAHAQVHDLQQRLAGAQLRVQRSQQQFDTFTQENATRLLEERAPAAREITAKLTASVTEAIGLHRALLAERAEQDRLVAAGGGNPRVDGPESTHPWERQLLDLERAVKEHQQLDPPLPRWQGRAQAEQRDRVHSLLRLRREGDQTAVEEFQREATT